MAKMKKLGPKIKEIAEKYKNDPQSKQKATMEFYRKEKDKSTWWLFTHAYTDACIYGLILGITGKCRVTTSSLDSLV